MKIVAYEAGTQTMIGSVGSEGAVTQLGEIGAFWTDPAALAKRGGGTPAGRLAALKQKPAVPLTGRVICVGLNYRQHAMEAKAPIPEVPVVFGRWAKTLIADGDAAPAVEQKFDWEGELGVVIGRRMFRVDAQQGLAGVFGYAACNDLSARTFQTQVSQWTLGKNSDASCPMSAIVTADEVGDPAKGLRLTTRVNGKTVQDSSTADMIFDVGQVIAHVSQVMTLDPGDLIITGTPSGVGFALGWFLKPGDVVEVEIEKIGVVRTPIVEAPRPIV